MVMESRFARASIFHGLPLSWNSFYRKGFVLSTWDLYHPVKILDFRYALRLNPSCFFLVQVLHFIFLVYLLLFWQWCSFSLQNEPVTIFYLKINFIILYSLFSRSFVFLSNSDLGKNFDRSSQIWCIVILLEGEKWKYKIKSSLWPEAFTQNPKSWAYHVILTDVFLHQKVIQRLHIATTTITSVPWRLIKAINASENYLLFKYFGWQSCFALLLYKSIISLF